MANKVNNPMDEKGDMGGPAWSCAQPCASDMFAACVAAYGSTNPKIFRARRKKAGESTRLAKQLAAAAVLQGTRACLLERS